MRFEVSRAYMVKAVIDVPDEDDAWDEGAYILDNMVFDAIGQTAADAFSLDDTFDVKGLYRPGMSSGTL